MNRIPFYQQYQPKINNYFKIMNQQKQRILIIGAGPSGLSLLRAFQTQKSTWQDHIELVCVQKQSQCGGQWNYIAKDKLDKHGMPIPSTNEYLWTNAPKECFEYPDYSFDQHFNGEGMPSYLPRQYLRQYFVQRFQSFGIGKYIQFDTIANNICFTQEENKFTVQIQNLLTNHKTTQHFDNAIVASGHYSLPNVPQVPGLKQFQGKLLHSIEVTDYLDYKNQRVLVIGSGLSAEDAILQCYKYGAKTITVTYRTRPMSQKFPRSIQQLPLLTKVEGKTVTFKNGEEREFDTIIMCTGYMHNFTFLEQKLRLKNSTKLWSDDLYMGTVFVDNPKLMYIGMQAQYFSFMMFDVQSHFVRNVILGSQKLPSQQLMRLSNIDKIQQQSEISTAQDVISFMGNYLKQLIHLSDYQNYSIDKVIELYYELQRHKEQNILTFRDNIYQSTVTGKWSVMKKETWLQAGSMFQHVQEDLQFENTLMKIHENFQELEINEFEEVEACGKS